MMDEINLNDYGVARKELFSPRNDIKLTLNKGSIYVNQYGVNLMQDVDYIKILVNREDRTLVIVPSAYGDKDAISWTRGRDKVTRHIRAIPLTYLILQLMNWDPYCRYVINGQLYRTNQARIMLFKLDDATGYKDFTLEEKEYRASQKTILPESWALNFGTNQHELDLINGIRIFEKEMVFEQEIKIDEEIKHKILEAKRKSKLEKENKENDNE